MLISVIAPTRNRPHLLKQALFGILAQTYADFEVHVVDDSSDEQTLQAYTEVWQSLDNRFKLHSIGGNGYKGLGPSLSRNYGLKQAAGTVVAFCDDDDTWVAPNHLAVMAEEFNRDSQLDMYIANQRAVSSSGSVKANWFTGLPQVLSNRPKTSESGYALSPEDLCNSGGFAHLNMLALRKTVTDQIGGFWERLSYEEDRDFFWRALGASHGVFFNPATVAQHNVPDAALQINQSTQHTWVERWLVAVLVSQHICATVTNLQITRLAMQYEGDLLRKLSLHFGQTGHPTAARQFALRALAARFSFKWAAHTALLLTTHALRAGRRDATL